jgi:hypothetical protein
MTTAFRLAVLSLVMTAILRRQSSQSSAASSRTALADTLVRTCLLSCLHCVLHCTGAPEVSWWRQKCWHRFMFIVFNFVIVITALCLFSVCGFSYLTEQCGTHNGHRAQCGTDQPVFLHTHTHTHTHTYIHTYIFIAFHGSVSKSDDNRMWNKS